MFKLSRRLTSNKPVVRAPPTPTGLPALRAKLTEKKGVKRMVVEKRKSDSLLDTGGVMFKVQGQFSGVFIASSIYAFYMAYFDVDLDELITPHQKATLEAAYFKMGASHLAWGVVFMPGSSLLFGRLLFRAKNWRQKRDVIHSMNKIGLYRFLIIYLIIIKKSIKIPRSNGSFN